jgi:hypothetical protein
MTERPNREWDKEESERIWAEMDKLAEEISKEWPKNASAVEAISEQRSRPRFDDEVAPPDLNVYYEPGGSPEHSS